jgi:hypothetical protein
MRTTYDCRVQQDRAGSRVVQGAVDATSDFCWLARRGVDSSASAKTGVVGLTSSIVALRGNKDQLAAGEGEGEGEGERIREGGGLGDEIRWQQRSRAVVDAV